MKPESTNIYEYEEDDSFDLVPYIKLLWAGKKLIIKITSIFFVIGILVALTSPNIYESQITFVPQTSDASSNTAQGYAKIASLAGININTESSLLDNYISPLLYSKIFESDEFSLSVINDKLILLDGSKLTVKDYLLSKSKNRFSILGFIKSILGFIKKYTIGLFTSDIKSDDEISSKEYLNSYNFISNADYGIIKSFKGKFTIELNKQDGYIRVAARDKDAFISTQLVKLITKNLQSRIISLRTSKIKEQLEYSREQYLKKQQEFETLQNNLAEFRDSNKNISTAVFLSKLEKLESEYQLQQNILMSLASEYNSNKIKLNKDTPIFSVLDEVSVPNERSKPNRKKLVIIYFLFGIIISTGYILALNQIKEFIKKIELN